MGVYLNNPGGLIEHWNGSQWSIVSNPAPGQYANDYYGVSAFASNDVWAVGRSSDSNNTPWRTLIEHWDGSAWSVIPSPNPTNPNNSILERVVAVSANDVWAVGNYYDYASGFYLTLIEHWNGSKWSIVPSPNPGTRDNFLYSVTTVSSSDVWAVGFYDNLGSVPTTALIEHWNGSQWSVVAGANVNNSLLLGVSAISSNDIWAVGSFGIGKKSRSLTEHWNGTGWSVVFSPNRKGSDQFVAVSANSTHEVWAVGDVVINQSAYHTLIEQWNGTSWKVMGSVDPGPQYNNLRDVAAVPGTMQAWTTGDYSTKNLTNYTLSEFYC